MAEHRSTQAGRLYHHVAENEGRQRVLIAGVLMVPGGGTVSLARGYVELRGDRIAEVGDGEPPREPDVRCGVICPGFIDAHAHLPQFGVIGADGMDLLAWLDRVVFPAEAAWEDAAVASGEAARAAAKMLAAGTTGVCAYATVHHAGARAAVEAVAGAGMRGVVGQVLMDRGGPPELLRPTAQLLCEAAELRPAGRVEPAVTPRFAVSCSAGLLAGAGELARATGQMVQTHLAETEEECRIVSEVHAGAGYVEVYRRAGLIGGRSVLAHGVWLDDAGRGVIEKAGAVVAHCPTANLFLRAGEMNLWKHRRAGVKVAVGSDVAGGPDVSMVRVARAMIETAKRVAWSEGLSKAESSSIPSAGEALWMVTRGNAAALGWDDAGRLEAGAAADVVLIDADERVMSAPDPVGALLYGWDDRWVRATIAAGRVVYGSLDKGRDLGIGGTRDRGG